MDTLIPYDDDYDTVVDQGQCGNAEGYCPELKPLHVDLTAYDTIVLGGTLSHPPCTAF